MTNKQALTKIAKHIIATRQRPKQKNLEKMFSASELKRITIYTLTPKGERDFEKIMIKELEKNNLKIDVILTP